LVEVDAAHNASVYGAAADDLKPLHLGPYWALALSAVRRAPRESHHLLF
jgi:hypothetical protein